MFRSLTTTLLLLFLTGRAVEAQSAALIHHVTPDNLIFGSVTVLDHPLLNFQANAMPLVTHLTDPNLDEVLELNDAQLAVHFDTPSGRWRIENIGGALLAVGMAFNVLVPRPAGTTGIEGDVFLHQSTFANIFDNRTVLNHPLLNGNPTARPMVMKTKNDVGGFNSSPIGVWYNSAGGNWQILYENEVPMASGERFFVCVDGCRLEFGIPTLIHTVCQAGITQFGPACYLWSADRLHSIFALSRVWNGAYHAVAVGLYWDPVNEAWAAITEDGSTMPENLIFAVAGPAAGAIFESSFESGDTLGWVAVP
jgi:hypothetical protein